MRVSNKFLVVSLVANVLLALLLFLLAEHYEFFRKFKRVIAEERRIPIITPSYERNRYYSSFREAFEQYQRQDYDALLVGDSLTAEINWLEFIPEYSIGGRGIPGDTSEGLLNRALDYHSPSVGKIAVWIGTNDILQGFKPTDTFKSVKKAVRHWSKENKKILLIPVPPVARWVKDAENKNAGIRELNELLGGLSDQPRITVADGFSAWTDTDGNLANSMTRDGVHLNVAGYSPVRQAIRDWLANQDQTSQ